MTREEAISILHGIRADNLNFDDLYTKDKYNALSMAIKALEQEPCDDTVSRQAVKEQMIKYGFHAPDMTVTEFVEDLPSVNPQPKGIEQIRAKVVSINPWALRYAPTYDKNIRPQIVSNVKEHVLEIIDKYRVESEL